MNPLGIATVFGLGFFYLVGAVPGGMAAGFSAPFAAFIAWCGYASGAVVMTFVGEPVRQWIARKLKIPLQHDPKKFVWKVWSRFGLPGLGLLAPVTIGPQAGCVLAMALGEKPWKAALALSLGAIPWCVGFAYAGAQVAKGLG
jgi:membrane protein YqaA with SNARE-associated domain